MKISVIIHTYNAEASLESVLKTVQNYDEILICDMYSSDRTIEIAEKYNCRIIYHEHVGYADPARQYSSMQAKYDWILMVDADECVPPSLKDYLKETVGQHPDIGAIRLLRKNYFMGKPVNDSRLEYITRFYRKDKVTWHKEIHTRPDIDGTIFIMPRDRHDLAFLHNGTPSLTYMIDKMNIYTNIEIRRRSKRSHGYSTLIFSPFARFFKLYIGRKGFRKGMPGFIWSVDAAIYKFYALAKTVESKVDIEDYDADFLSYFGDDLRRIEKEEKAKML